MAQNTVLKKTVWQKLSESERDEATAIGEDYKAFLDAGKTERLCIGEILRRAREQRFAPFDPGQTLKPGDKVYFNNRDKAVVLYIVGEQNLTKGLNIVGSHVDSPRIDIKQNPLYEDGGLVLMKTHYYGFIKKYHWVAMPLALYGVIVRADGVKVQVAVGDSADDPVFCITDLLPHLSALQDAKKADEVIEGEAMNAVVGSIPAQNVEEDAYKAAILVLLKNKYGIEEEDFISAELELVPAGLARDVGFDRGLIGSYGHDDRVCAYASLRALLNLSSCGRTAATLFVDKEEIGSYGNTGMHSRFFTDTLSELLAATSGCDALSLRRALSASAMLSADVCAGLDPTYPSVSDVRNNAYMGCGPALMKYTGSHGKGGANDAHAEYIGALRRLFKGKEIPFQTTELGKVDAGGGGTIASMLAHENMDVIDMGVPVLNMHAPFELVSKADVYVTVRAYQAFLSNFTRA